MTDQRTNEQWREDLEAWLRRVERTLKRRVTQMAVALGIALLLFGGGFTAVLIAQSSVTDRIDFERARNTWISCNDQNRRNRDTKTELPNLGIPPAESMFASHLIDRLQPFVNCRRDLIVPRFGDDLADDVQPTLPKTKS